MGERTNSRSLGCYSRSVRRSHEVVPLPRQLSLPPKSQNGANQEPEGEQEGSKRSTTVEVHTVAGVQGRPGPLHPPCGGQFYYGNRRHYDGGKFGSHTTQIVEMYIVVQELDDVHIRRRSVRDASVTCPSPCSASRLPANCGTRNKPISSCAERQMQRVDDAATAMSIER